MRVEILACLILLTAGCADSSKTDPLPESPGADAASTQNGTAPAVPREPLTSLDWTLENCRFMYSNALADAAAVQDSLPEGFTVTTDTAGRVGVGFETNVCTSGSGFNGSIEDQTYATVWVGITPPGHLANEAGAFHVMNFEVLVEDADRRDWMNRRGIPAVDGSISLTEVGPFQQIIMDLGGNPFVFDIGQLQPAAGGGGTFDQWTPGTEGLTYWRTDWATVGQFQSVGTVQIPTNSIYASWFESPVVPAQFNVGVWNYTNGTIVHPAPTNP